jgi:hypothetical protein
MDRASCYLMSSFRRAATSTIARRTRIDQPAGEGSRCRGFKSAPQAQNFLSAREFIHGPFPFSTTSPFRMMSIKVTYFFRTELLRTGIRSHLFTYSPYHSAEGA